MKRKVFSIVSIASFLIGLVIFQWGDGLARNYGGDIVVVLFLYALLSITTSWRPPVKAGSVVIFAIGIELFQLVLHLPLNAIAELTVGSSFDPFDFIAYTIGAAVGLLIDGVVQAKT